MKILPALLLLCLPILLDAQSIPDGMGEGRWYHILHFQATAGQTSWEASEFGFGAEHVSGRVLGSRLRAGLGTGINMLGYGNHKRLVPVFAEIRYQPFERFRHRPFVVLDGGYAFAWMDKGTADINRKVSGGPRMHLAAGVEWKTRRGWALFTDFGYLRQRSVLERNNFWWGGGGADNYIRETHRMQRWMWRIGLGF
ncbi:MAG: hypothetical protein ACOYOO_12080 [Saprospiraceae bacterium]